MSYENDLEHAERRRQARRDGDPGPGEQPHGLRFDKTINLSHVISVLALVVALMVQWNLLDKRIQSLEEARSAQRERDMMQDALAREKFQEVKEYLLELKSAVTRVADKVGVSR